MWQNIEVVLPKLKDSKKYTIRLKDGTIKEEHSYWKQNKEFTKHGHYIELHQIKEILLDK